MSSELEADGVFDSYIGVYFCGDLRNQLWAVRVSPLTKWGISRFRDFRVMVQNPTTCYSHSQ
jgi:hypothetical protein